MIDACARLVIYMMFYTTDYQANYKPCKGECYYRRPRKPEESLCLKCGMTEREKQEWRSMSLEARLALSFEVNDRMNYAWMMWEVMEQPTKH